MRFDELQGLTSLPAEHVRHRFRNEEVITVLPVRGTAGRQSLLVATPLKAAVVVGDAPASEHWMTYWAPWDTVQIINDQATEDGWYTLTLLIGRLAFEARLPGSEGRRALRQFVLAVRSGQSALAPFDRPGDPARPVSPA